MNYKSMLSGLLAATMAAGLVLPAGAANGDSSFSDISDPTLALQGDILRLMGVVSGTGGNQFQPNLTLTRAQFCTMAVNFMGLADQVPLHATRTIFSDVPSSHWARGYINLAASTNLGGGGEEGTTASPLISGVGDGRFLPDQEITFAQAVTILIRVLSYSSEQIGALWPDSYMNIAASIGLTDGLSLSPNAVLNRAQAAQLLVNALSCATGSGKAYYTGLGQVKEDVILLAVNTQTDDGSAMGAIRTSDGTYLPANDGVIPTALVGHRGDLVVNDKGELVTFVPDDSDSQTITLRENASPSYLVDMAGKRYTISPDTPVYSGSSSQGTAYSEAYTSLSSSSRLTLFLLRGKVVAIYSSSASSTVTATDAVVVQGSAKPSDFYTLTGGTEGYTILKGQQKISLSDLRPNDVVTYDSLTNTLFVSDLRMDCVYENPSPNASSPLSITVLGHEFPVLDSAWYHTGDLKIGDSVTLLLTADGAVADIVKAGTASAKATAVGYTTSSTTANLFLPNGGTLELKSGNKETSNVGQVVQISGGSKDSLVTTRLSGTSAPGSFDPAAMKLGSLTVLPTVRVYEQFWEGTQAPTSLADLGSVSVPANQVVSYHTNSSGMVDVIVFNSITGNAYTYGILTADTGSVSKNRTVTVTARTSSGPYITGYDFKDGGFGGVVKSSETLDGTAKAASVIQLTQLKDVSSSQFFQKDGRYYLSHQGRTYLVPDTVECYRASSRTWYQEDNGYDRLRAAIAFSSQPDVYIDPVGQQVRVISVG